MIENDEDRLARVELVPYAGSAYRHQSPDLDPLSGVGARRRGGRFNPPRSFPVLYLGLELDTVAAELRRSAARTGLNVLDALPREVFRYDVDVSRVLDLRDPSTLDALETTLDELLAADRLRGQQIGVAALHSDAQAILAPSATGTGTVLAVLLDNLGASRCTANLQATWRSLGDFEQPPTAQA